MTPRAKPLMLLTVLTKIKSFSRYTAVLLLLFPALILTHTVGAAEDKEPPTGTFLTGQNWPTSPEYRGSIYGVKDNIGVTKVEIFLNDKFHSQAVYEHTDVWDMYFGNWGQGRNNPKLPPGKNKVEAKIYDEAGNVGFAKVKDSPISSLFLIVRSTSPVKDTRQKTETKQVDKCEQRLEQMNKLMDKIVDRQQRRVDFIDNVLEKVELYYQDKNLSLSNYDQLLATILDKQTAVDNALLALASKDAVNCELELDAKAQIKDFQTALAQAKEALTAYRHSVQDLIKAIQAQ